MALAPRQKKLIIVIGFLPALLAYAAIVIMLADFLPKHWLAQFIFYVVVGVAWAFPLKPLMLWSNRPAGMPADHPDAIPPQRRRR